MNRVAHVVPALKTGGMENFVLSLASIQQPGARIVCTSFAGELAQRASEMGTSVSVATSPLRANLFPRELIADLKESPVDILHSHSGSWLKAASAHRNTRTKIHVHTIHGFHEGRRWLHEPLERLAARNTDIVVCVSEQLADHVQSRLKVTASRCRIVRNGVDVDKFETAFQKNALRRRERQSDSRVTFGFVGRLIDVKDPALLIRSFHALLQSTKSNSLPELSLMLVGDGPLRSDLERLCSELDVTERVRFVGDVRDPRPFLEEIDVFCLPSRSEGTSIALLESLASGCTVVASAVGGTPSVLDGGQFGTLIDSRHAADWADGLRLALSRLEDRTSELEKARAHVAAHFSLARTAEEYRELYGA